MYKREKGQRKKTVESQDLDIFYHPRLVELFNEIDKEVFFFSIEESQLQFVQIINNLQLSKIKFRILAEENQECKIQKIFFFLFFPCLSEIEIILSFFKSSKESFKTI